MLDKLLKNTRFKSKLKDFLAKNKEVLDIILFGSVVRGKDKPSDIDILVIYKNKENLDLNHALKKDLDALGLKSEVISGVYKKLFSNNFAVRESLLSEGYSMLNNKFVGQSWGYKSFILFRYSLKEFNKSKRMRFYYSLYGRNSPGVIRELHSYKFSDTVIATPVIYGEKMKEYLKMWGIEYTEVPILVPERVVNAENFRIKP